MIESLGYESNQFARALVKSNQTFKIGIIVNSSDHKFYQRIKKGITMQFDNKKQFEYIVLENKIDDAKEQLNNINTLLEQNVDGLVITPIYDDAINNKLDQLTIPVVVITHDITINSKIAFVGCDYVSNGIIASDLINAITTNNHILIVLGPNHILSYKLRYQGFISNLNPNITYDVITTDNTNSDVKDKTHQYLKSSNPGAIYFAGYGISGLLETLDKLNKTIKIVAVDETDEVIEGLKANKISLTVTQQPEKQGYRAVAIIKDYLLLKKEPKISNIVGNKIKVKNSNFNEKI